MRLSGNLRKISMNFIHACFSKIIRETVNQSPDLLQDDLVLFRLAIRQLVGVAHNLNQLVKAIHSGFSPFSIETRTILETRDCALNVKKRIGILRTSDKAAMGQSTLSIDELILDEFGSGSAKKVKSSPVRQKTSNTSYSKKISHLAPWIC